MKGIGLLAVAIFFEILATTSMKLSEGFTRWLPSVLLFIFYGISFTLFTFAAKYLHISVAYAIWAGIGTAIISLIGFFIFEEPVTIPKVVSILFI